MPPCRHWNRNCLLLLWVGETRVMKKQRPWEPARAGKVQIFVPLLRNRQSGGSGKSLQRQRKAIAAEMKRTWKGFPGVQRKLVGATGMGKADRE